MSEYILPGSDLIILTVKVREWQAIFASQICTLNLSIENRGNKGKARFKYDTKLS